MRELSLNVLDVAQNSVTAGATQLDIILTQSTAQQTLTIEIKDNGCGMTKEQLASVRDPFFTTRTTRKVGLGVPLFKMAAEMTGGDFDIDSAVGVGTTVRAFFHTDHVDFVPIGDMASTVVSLMAMNPQVNVRYCRAIDGKDFSVESETLAAILGDVPLNEPSIMRWLTEYINENTNELTEVQT
ncbi:MAG: sensor histidine kinase [Clostridia bacterium]|nr:sensor histidine kinase [Clostridia bacterium]